MTSTTQWVEKPPHVHPTRMRHIDDAELRAALTTGPESLTGWRIRLPGRRPVWDIGGWADRVGDGAAATAAIRAADDLLDREVDFLDPGHGKSRLYGLHYLGWLSPLVSAYALTGDPRYALSWDRLFAQWYDSRDHVVGEWPGLDAVWYSLGVCSRSALTIQALSVFRSEPALSDRCWTRMLATVLGGARWAAEEHDSFRHGNWQLACCAELLHVAGVIPEFGESAEWAAIAQDRLLEHLELDVYADGGHYERSPGYHTMCLNALQRAAIVGAENLGWNAIAEHPRFRAMHDWLITMAAPAGWVPAFQDSGIIWPAVSLLRGHHLLGDPTYKELARRWLGPDRLRDELAWLRPVDGVDAATRFAAAPVARPDPASRTLASSGYTVLRTGWDSADLTTVVNHGPYVGHELEPHSHHAALDFVISGWGIPLAWEAGGPPSYDDPEYYRWFQATRGHNAVVLDEEFTEDRKVQVTELHLGAETDVFAGSHDGYSRRHYRRISFHRGKPHFWLITDEVEGDGEAQWLLHGLAPWLARSGGGYAPERGPGLLVIPLEPDGVAGVRFDRGRSRIPDPATGTADFGEVHTIALLRAERRFDTVLIPFAEKPPRVVIHQDNGTVDVVVDSVRGQLAGDSR
ncbi:MAG TPA: heparinase II/III family protein [Mycobacteriales bacterium]|nr:heparinase II/III family protein [Mycobacteriales bacterium]